MKKSEAMEVACVHSPPSFISQLRAPVYEIYEMWVRPARSCLLVVSPDEVALVPSPTCEWARMCDCVAR